MKAPSGQHHSHQRLKPVQRRFVGISRRSRVRGLRKSRQDKDATHEEEVGGESFHNATSYCAKPPHRIAEIMKVLSAAFMVFDCVPTLPGLLGPRGSRTSRARRRPAVWMPNRCKRLAPRCRSAATWGEKEIGEYQSRRRQCCHRSGLRPSLQDSREKKFAVPTQLLGTRERSVQSEPRSLAARPPSIRSEHGNRPMPCACPR